MAPEQHSEFHNAKATTDIYSFGCILHDLVTSGNRTPFQPHTAAGPLGPIIEKCTAIDPSKRFQNISPLRAALVHALSRGVATVPDASTVEWEEELRTFDTWTSEKAKSFVRFLRGTSERLLLKELDEDRLQTFFALDGDAWDEVAGMYCDWAAQSGFDFDYCDVLIGRLEKIFNIGSPSLKTSAAIAAAKLGAGHNRWYVMRRLLSLCGPAMDATIAERLSIEILAEEAKDDFVRCVERISKSPKEYHPLIQEVLEKPAAGEDKKTCAF
jgi:eukaryotic-like serine/threonine-protein kinase